MTADSGLLFAGIGAALSVGLSAIGAGYGTARCANAIATVFGASQTNEEAQTPVTKKVSTETPVAGVPSLLKILVPVIMCGVIGIYGLIVAVLILQGDSLTLVQGYARLGGGLGMGLAGLGSGAALGFVGEAAILVGWKNPGQYWKMVLVLIFTEALGLYGLICAILATQIESLEACPVLD